MRKIDKERQREREKKNKQEKPLKNYISREISKM